MATRKRSEPPESGAAVAKVYAALRMPIVDGDIAPGTRVNIEAVARELGVSQTPVREALQRLESDDLLVYTPGRGYRTAPVLDPAGLRSVFEFRLLVEPWASRITALDSLSNPAGALDEELTTFEMVAQSGKDIRQQMLAHDARFHDIILTAAGNPVVRQAYQQTHCHLHLFRLYPVDVRGTVTIEEHRAIWRAIRDCAPEASAQAMADHIKNSYQRSVRAFEQPVPPIDSGGRSIKLL